MQHINRRRSTQCPLREEGHEQWELGVEDYNNARRPTSNNNDKYANQLNTQLRFAVASRYSLIAHLFHIVLLGWECLFDGVWVCVCLCVGVCVVEIRHLQCDRFAFKTFQANENPQAVNALPLSWRRIKGKHLVRMIEFQKSTKCLISIIISIL